MIQDLSDLGRNFPIRMILLYPWMDGNTRVYPIRNHVRMRRGDDNAGRLAATARHRCARMRRRSAGPFAVQGALCLPCASGRRGRRCMARAPGNSRCTSRAPACLGRHGAVKGPTVLQRAPHGGAGRALSSGRLARSEPPSPLAVDGMPPRVALRHDACLSMRCANAPLRGSLPARRRGRP